MATQSNIADDSITLNKNIMFNVTTKPEQFCLQAIIGLERVPAAPRNVQAKTNVLDRLIAPDNAAGWSELDVVNIPGKKAPDGTNSGPKIYLEYEKPYCDGGESDGDISICDVDGSTTEQKSWLIVDIDQVAERHFTVSKEEFNNFCEGPQQRVMEMLRRKSFEIRREINKKCIEELYAQLNNYVGNVPSVGANTKAVTVINQDGNIIPAGLSKVNGEYARANYSGPLLIFGGETLRSYFDVKMLQGMSMNSVGASVDPFANMPFVYDNQFDTIFQTLETDTNSHAVTLPLGGMHLHQWLENTGYMAESFEDHLATTMNIDGMEFDYNMHYDKCDKVWKLQLKKKYGFGTIPAAAYCDSQGLIWHWLFQCGDFSCASL